MRRLVIDHGVNVGSHTSPGPTSKTRGSTGATDEQQSLDVVRFRSGVGLFIVRHIEVSGFVMTVTFLKIIRHVGVDGHQGWTRWCVGYVGTYWRS